MENENPTELNPEQQAPVEAQAHPAEAQSVQAQPAEPEKPKKKGWKYALVGVLILAAGALGYFGYTQPELFTELFKAEIREAEEQVPEGAAYLYIPNYEASPKEEDGGTISIKTKDLLGFSENIASMKFTLTYEPDVLIFNENSIVFDHVEGNDTTTVFSSANLDSVNTNIPGKVVISFFSTTPAVIDDTDGQTLVKLAVEIDGTPGSTINLNVEDVEVIKKVDSNYEMSSQFTQIDAGTIDLVTQENLRVLNVETLDEDSLLVSFSDLLLPDYLGGIVNYTINDLTIAEVKSGYLNGYGQDTVILETSTQDSDTLYTLEVTGDVRGNVQGGISPNYRKVLFKGYQDTSPEDISDVKLQSIAVISGTELRLEFSGDIDFDTVTQINIGIQKLLPSEASLTITGVGMVDARTVSLTTEQQDMDVNYFVILNGVKDASGATLVNNHVLNFFGFTVPPMSVENISPVAVTNNVEQVIRILGQNLDSVTQARLDNMAVSINEQSEGALDIIVPIGFATDVYDLTLVSAAGETLTLADALIVSLADQPMRILSGESRAIPYRVPPDGETEITFWVLVEDPRDLNEIDSVTIDLEQIGGDRAQEMEKDTGQQPQFRQYYTFNTTVDPVTPTQEQPYQLAVQVKKGNETADGIVSIVVTQDVLGSVAPTIDQLYANPSTIPPNGVTTATISATVTDPDGADTITSVVADLGPIGVGFMPLDRLDVGGEANEQVTGWFASDEFTLSANTPEGNYTVTITAADSTGESSTMELNINVSSALTEPIIDPDRSYIAPRKSVPKDNRTPFSLHAMISDPDGVGDIDSVTAYFGTLGLTPVTLLRDPNASEAAKTALYSSPDITIPPITPLGVHQIEIVATDKTGGTGNAILLIDVTYEDVIGDAPLIFDDKSYTTPRIAVNDGQTSITLYAFVRDDDDDLESVVVNLSTIGQVGPEIPQDFGQPGVPPEQQGVGDGTCPTNSKTIVCMQPSFKEGRDGQWFVLPDVTISTMTPASSQPYTVEVIATDIAAKTARGQISIFVSDSEGFVADSNPPELVAAVPTGESTVEVVFNEELSALTISSGGSEFEITDQADINQKLNVVGATINAAGNIVTLTTDPQVVGKDYVLTASNKITDAAGIALVPGRDSRASFAGFEDSSKMPIVHYVAATDIDTVEIEFQKNLRPSSIKLGEVTGDRGGDFDIKIFESETSNPLQVRAVRFIESGKLLEVKTEQQKSGQRYGLQIENIASAAGVKLKSAVAKFFKAIRMRAIMQAVVENQADLNRDGKVDFIDFTMFSSVYGQVFGNNAGNGGQGLDPIPPEPDATVPPTEPVN